MPEVIRQHVPMATRWTLFALGSVEGQRVRRPRDPVAAWLLHRHPDLLPAFAAPSILSMIRARANLIDGLIEDAVNGARQSGETLDFWSFGAGFDARWYRLMHDMSDVITSHQEVDEPALLAFKNATLADSNFATAWKRIGQHPTAKKAWTIQATASRSLITLEGVSTRLGSRATLELLTRLRKDAPTATVIVDLPGYLNSSTELIDDPTVLGSIRARWSSATRSGAAQVSTRHFRELGFQVIEDHWFSARPELRSPSGTPICPGTEAFRVLVLQAAD